MKVLILHSRYSSGAVSGENAVVDDEALLLREAGHDISLWALDPNSSTSASRAALAARAVWSRSVSEQVHDFVRDRGIDVVHFHNLFPMVSPAAIRAANRAGAATVMTLHNYRLSCLNATFARNGEVCEVCSGHVPWRGVLHACYRSSRAASAVLATALTVHRAVGSFSMVDRFIAVSEFVRQKHIDAGLAAEKIVVKPNFAWSTESREGAGSYFLFVGRVAQEKGLDRLIKCWLPKFGRLVVVGDGPDVAALSRSAGAQIEFTGRLEGSALRAAYRGARALLLPTSLYEGAPRVIVEAYAAGVPVAASDAGAIGEFVLNGRTGLLVSNGDSASWQRAIEHLLLDTESIRMGREAHGMWFERFSPGRTVSDLESTYSELVGRRTGAAQPGLGSSQTFSES